LQTVRPLTSGLQQLNRESPDEAGLSGIGVLPCQSTDRWVELCLKSGFLSIGGRPWPGVSFSAQLVRPRLAGEG